MSELWRRLRMLFRRERFDRDLEEEMRFHLEMKARQNREAGMDVQEARYAAMRRFGNGTRLSERSREAWGWGPLERIGQDLQYAFRMLRKNPGFSSVAVLVLALGIGGSTTVFSLVNALILHPFPYPQPDRLVDIQVRQKGGQWQTSVCVRDFLDWRQQNAVFAEMATYGYFRSNVTGIQEPERMFGGRVTSGFLRVFGVQPALGRFFTPAEDVPGGPPVVVLSYALWQRQFGGRADVLGQKLTAVASRIRLSGSCQTGSCSQACSPLSSGGRRLTIQPPSTAPGGPEITSSRG
jgi:hypothetical protein